MVIILFFGIGSGLDVELIIMKLMVFEQQFIIDINKKIDGFKIQLLIYGQIQSLLLILCDVVVKLINFDIWVGIKIMFSDFMVVMVIVFIGVVIGSLLVSVSQFVVVQILVFFIFFSSMVILGQGLIIIEFGSWVIDVNSGVISFMSKFGVMLVIINIGLGQDQFMQVCD